MISRVLHVACGTIERPRFWLKQTRHTEAKKYFLLAFDGTGKRRPFSRRVSTTPRAAHSWLTRLR
jgi:hypothetical protein